MRKNFLDACKYLEFPKEATEELLKVFDRIIDCDECKLELETSIRLYKNNMKTNLSQIIDNLETKAELHSINKYSFNMIYFLSILSYAKEFYIVENIEENIFLDGMKDLKWKLFECYKVYGVWGTFVPKWNILFFQLDIFALGRLQFEPIKSSFEWSDGKNKIEKDDILLNVHIPSCGVLSREECIKAYYSAKEFFKKYFLHRATIFTCDSWLLFINEKSLVLPESNIAKFANDYTTISIKIDDKNSDLWRVFGKEYHNNINEMPCETTLQQSFHKYIKNGENCGSILGVYVFK